MTSLYTREFYQAVQRRLAPGGIFTQWVQGYDVDGRTIRLVYATLSSVFPYVETWSTQPGDLLFVCYQEAPAYSAEQLRQRVQVEPFAEALKRIWLTNSAEGVIAHYLASPALAREIQGQEQLVNTDDRNLLEYSFARSLVSEHKFNPDQIAALASRRQFSLPEQLVGKLDISKVDEERLLFFCWPPSEIRDSGDHSGRGSQSRVSNSGLHQRGLRNRDCGIGEEKRRVRWHA